MPHTAAVISSFCVPKALSTQRPARVIPSLSRDVSHTAFFAGFVLTWFLPLSAHAAVTSITYRHKHFLFTIQTKEFSSQKLQEDVWTLNGEPIEPAQEWLVDGDVTPSLPAGVKEERRPASNREAIKAVIERHAGPILNREASDVTIGKDAKGKIVFEGVGLTGRGIDLEGAADLTQAAMEKGISDVELPVIETQPKVTVTDPELRAAGIKEIVTIGESEFSNSPANRRHNIATGLAKFNGHLIPKDTVFSFVGTLGPVDGSTGYLKELVIKGDQTVPDYGGGLCQVSSTAYRGVWEYGFPITQRKNHSYTVSHYSPQGTDATVYPPNVDIKFRNDGPSALLMQTYAKGDLAYFIYYGTHDERKSNVFGPFIWDRVAPPPDRTEYTTDLPPGEKKKVGERVPGMKTMWYRVLTDAKGVEKTEPVFSSYQARPLYYLVGAESVPSSGSGATTDMPTWFESDTNPLP